MPSNVLHAGDRAVNKTKFFPPVNLHHSGERETTSEQITNVSDHGRCHGGKKGGCRGGCWRRGTEEKEETECP